MIVLRLPSGLRGEFGSQLSVDQPVATIGELVAALEDLRPGLGEHLHDSLYNFAVNDTLILHGTDRHALADGDIVELIPTIAGG